MALGRGTLSQARSEIGSARHLQRARVEKPAALRVTARESPERQSHRPMGTSFWEMVLGEVNGSTPEVSFSIAGLPTANLDQRVLTQSCGGLSVCA